MRTLFLAIAIVGTCGCDRQDRPPPMDRGAPTEPPASPEALARALGQDAASLAPAVDPPPKAGDLKEDIAHFKSVEACISERMALDPVVGDALLAIGYDTFLRDACRVLDAAKAKDARRCGPIEASALRAHCEAFVAIIGENPDACPLDIAGDATRGHDPTCIAAAARDVRLCAGESDRKRGNCEALLTGDDKKCGEQNHRVCARDVARWKSILAANPPSRATPMAPAKGTLTIHGAEGTPDPPQTSADLSVEVARGVVLAHELGGTRLRVGSLQELGVIPHASNPVARPRIGFELLVAHDPPSDAKIEHLELDIPGAVTVVMPSMGGTLKAHVTKLDKMRAGEVQITIDGTAGNPKPYAVHSEIATFVRDVVGFSKR